MKRAHAIVISALVAAAVVVGASSVLRSSGEAAGETTAPAAVAIPDPAVDAAVARETQRLDNVERSLEKALKDNPEPVRPAPVIRYVESPVAAAAQSARTAQRWDDDDHADEDDEHEGRGGYEHEEDD